MVTPDGRWRVEVLRTRGGEVFRVRRLDVVSRGTWAPRGLLRFTVAEVADLLGDAFRYSSTSRAAPRHERARPLLHRAHDLGIEGHPAGHSDRRLGTTGRRGRCGVNLELRRRRG